MKMYGIHILEDEITYGIAELGKYNPVTASLSDEFVQRYNQVVEAFESVQKELAEIYNSKE